jgi:hypothetical protein
MTQFSKFAWKLFNVYQYILLRNQLIQEGALTCLEEEKNDKQILTSP